MVSLLSWLPATLFWPMRVRGSGGAQVATTPHTGARVHFAACRLPPVPVSGACVWSLGAYSRMARQRGSEEAGAPC